MRAVTELSYLQAVVIGALQGVTEMFPISSLGHSVLVPAIIGGSWAHLVTETGTSGSPYLSFVIALHVATALALLMFYWRDWARILDSLVTSILDRRIQTPSQHLAWLLVLATIPVGVVGLALEHPLRTLFAKPLVAAVFLMVNGLILLTGERLRRRSESVAAIRTEGPADSAPPTGRAAARQHVLTLDPATTTRPLESLSFKEGVFVGLFQTLALLAGISRSGVTMVGGLLRGLDHEDAAKFAFLLATPVILAAGLLKMPDLARPAAVGIHGPILAGAVTAAVSAYLAVRFLTRYLTTRTLTPFAIYSLVAGGGCALWFIIGA